MNYISHVLHYPNQKPFDNPELCWPAFIGEFVAPIVSSRPELLFWFTHYGKFARFRVYTNQYEDFRVHLEELRDKLGLIDKGEEKDLTLVNDIGSMRFISAKSTSTPLRRAELILESLSSVARLVIDSIEKKIDGYWQFEQNEDLNQNPDGCHLFSVMHLFHNMTASDGYVHIFNYENTPQILSYYYFLNAVNNNQIEPTWQKPFRIKM